MILDDCQQLNQKIDQYEEIQRQRDHAEDLENRRKELEEKRNNLKLSLQSALVFIEAELLDQADLPSSTALDSSLAQVHHLFHDDPLRITEGQAYEEFLTKLVEVREEIDQICDQVWEDFTSDTAPVVDTDLLQEREDIPEFESTVTEIRALQEELELAADTVPSTEEELSQYREKAKTLGQEIEKLYTDDYPQEVIEFLRAANTRKGASLSMLTPAVLEWLEDNDKMDGFSVKTTA